MLTLCTFVSLLGSRWKSVNFYASLKHMMCGSVKPSNFPFQSREWPGRSVLSSVQPIPFRILARKHWSTTLRTLYWSERFWLYRIRTKIMLIILRMRYHALCMCPIILFILRSRQHLRFADGFGWFQVAFVVPVQINGYFAKRNLLNLCSFHICI